jgi:hypothetical protein
LARSSAEASRAEQFAGKWGHFQDSLGRPHGLALARVLGKELVADHLLILQLGAGAAGLLAGALLYFLGYLHGRASNGPPDELE